ncbi:spike glycoprotein [Sparrow coronavirus HKU17]|uniref:spike glycoprotein n=1 Tax=Sparrow coronavirus HKU17 TaxID=1159906 RepID=UPI00025719BE|nr:spike glycoprotein [Sparrow coronavirus HKU17]AFD29209.1 spike glycoprotein [Sparrow coronavirus HKU17]
MQGALLITFIAVVTSSPLADKILDFLTFPEAHAYLFPQSRMVRNIEGGATERCMYVQEGGFIPDNFTFPQWFVLTNDSTLLQGELTTSQPLIVNGHLCSWQSNQQYRKYSFNTSCPLPADGCNPTWGSGNLKLFKGWNNTKGLTDNIRINVNISQSDYRTSAGSVGLELEGGGTVNITCTNSSTPVTTYSLLPWARSSGEPIYCFANVSSPSQSYIDFMGILPPFVSEIAFDRSGSIYINGYRYFKISPLLNVELQLNFNLTSDHFSVTWSNYTEVHLNTTNGYIHQIKYCYDPLDKLACEMNTFQLPDGVYPYTPAQQQALPETFVTTPVYANHTTVVVRTQYTVSSTGINGPPSWSTVELDGAINDTLCVNSRQFTVHLNTTVHYTAAHLFGTEFVAGTCPFTLPNINNYLTFGSICFSTVNNGGCTIHVQKVLRHYRYTFGTIYVSYQPGNQITAMPKASSGTTDISTVYLNVCTKYNIYGKTGTGVITKTNETHIGGLYYSSLSGDLLAFKNSTTQTIYSITPCELSAQVAVYNDSIIAAFTSTENFTFSDFSYKLKTPMFYYHSIGNTTCEAPAITFGSIGVCPDGGLIIQSATTNDVDAVVPISTQNISIPINFTVSIQTEYIQIEHHPITVDCRKYVCNGNPRCLQLLLQYTSACSTIEQALALNARLEAASIQSMLTYNPQTVKLANITNFQSDGIKYDLSSILPVSTGSRSAIEDLLFDKVVTNGLGTVDQDYKKCTNGYSIADLVCAQYYNGIMVLPGVADPEKLAQYTASLTGAMVFGGLTSAAAIPFSLAVQSRLNYVALQTDVLQRNQQILATSFNNAMGNITQAFHDVNQGLSQVAGAVTTIANAFTKIQDVVNAQGTALSTLTTQLTNNFQAISASIADIYNRLNQIEADAQVDRLITGRLAALNAFVTQTLAKLAEVRQSRQLALDKVNECVKSQSARYGFCGNGTHLFSFSNAAPYGLMFFHTVLLPTQYATVQAYSGICHQNRALTLRDPSLALFQKDDKYLITPRNMYQPRTATKADFVYIQSCDITFLNLTDTTIEAVIPDYVDVNKTIEEFLNNLPNYTLPDLSIDRYNNTILNLTTEIADLNGKAANLSQIVEELEQYIKNINSTLVDLEWLNRVETYIKWPWYIWLAIALAFTAFVAILITIFLCTGCCGGCFGCCGGCFGLFSKKKRYTDDHPTPSFKFKEW